MVLRDDVKQKGRYLFVQVKFLLLQNLELSKCISKTKEKGLNLLHMRNFLSPIKDTRQ